MWVCPEHGAACVTIADCAETVHGLIWNYSINNVQEVAD
jgi:hypothetical protein